MPTALITPESMIDQPAPYVDSLRRAGFEIRYPTNRQLSRGISSDEETIAELEGVAAVLAGGELFNRRVLTALPQLRVIARVGVGVLVTWAWNGLIPEYPMPAEVAIPAAVVLGRVIRYLAAFLPDPHGEAS